MSAVAPVLSENPRYPGNAAWPKYERPGVRLCYLMRLGSLLEAADSPAMRLSRNFAASGILRPSPEAVAMDVTAFAHKVFAQGVFANRPIYDGEDNCRVRVYLSLKGRGLTHLKAEEFANRCFEAYREIGNGFMSLEEERDRRKAAQQEARRRAENPTLKERFSDFVHRRQRRPLPQQEIPQREGRAPLGESRCYPGDELWRGYDTLPNRLSFILAHGNENFQRNKKLMVAEAVEDFREALENPDMPQDHSLGSFMQIAEDLERSLARFNGRNMGQLSENQQKDVVFQLFFRELLAGVPIYSRNADDCRLRAYHTLMDLGVRSDQASIAVENVFALYVRMFRR